MTTIKKTWGMEVKAIREYHNLSIEYVAQRLGKSVGTIQRYEGINPKTPGKSYEKGVSQKYLNEFYDMLTKLGLSTSID